MVLASGITSLPPAAVVLALPTIRTEFDASTADLAWIVTAFNLAYSALLVVSGRQADVLGRRLVLVAGAAIFGASSVLAALAPGSGVLIAAMAGIGVGAAVLSPASLAVITEEWPPAERGRAIGLWGASSAVVQAIGPLVGGLFTDGLDWRFIFWVNVPVAALIALLAVRYSSESKDPAATRHVDITGFLLVTAGLSALTLALIQGATWEWTSAPVILLVGVSAACLVGVVVVERRVRNPLVRLELFSRRNFTGANVVVFVLNFVIGAALFFLPQFMQEIQGDSPLRAGVLLLPLSAALALALPVGGPIADRHGPRPPIFVGLAVCSAGAFWLSTVSATTGYAGLWPGMLLMGLGTGLALTPMNLAAMNAIPRTEAGAGSGLLITLSGLGATFGVAVTGAVFQQLFTDRTISEAAARGVTLTENEAEQLDGLLSGTPSAGDVLSGVPAGSASAVEAGVREAFSSAIGTTMLVTAFVGVAGLVLTALVMRGGPAVAQDA
jgi:EmrB/QacA subfamily drug resistance transporter